MRLANRLEMFHKFIKSLFTQTPFLSKKKKGLFSLEVNRTEVNSERYFQVYCQAYCATAHKKTLVCIQTKCWSRSPSKDMWHVRLCARLPVMPCQIKETQAAASHRAKWNNAGERREGSFFCSCHSGKKKNPDTACYQSKLLALYRGKLIWKECKRQLTAMLESSLFI